VIVKTQMHQTQAAEVSLKPKWLTNTGGDASTKSSRTPCGGKRWRGSRGARLLNGMPLDGALNHYGSLQKEVYHRKQAFSKWERCPAMIATKQAMISDQ